MKSTATVRLVDKKTRVVEVLGPLPPDGRRPKLLLNEYGLARPQQIEAVCFKTSGRVATFFVDRGKTGDQLLDLLDRHPIAKARPVSSYGPRRLGGAGVTGDFPPFWPHSGSTRSKECSG